MKEPQILFLSEDDIDTAVTMQDALETTRAAFVAQALGFAVNLPRQRVQLSNALFQVMGGLVSDETPSAVADPTSGWMLSKNGASTSDTRRTWSLLFDPQANLRCILLSQRLGQLRTAAATAVSIDALARPEAKVMACLGAGFHARAAIHATRMLRPEMEVLIWSRTAASADRLVARLRDEHQVVSSPCLDVAEACGRGDVLVTMTTAGEPVLPGRPPSSS